MAAVAASLALFVVPAIADATIYPQAYAVQNYGGFESQPGYRHSSVNSNYLAFTDGYTNGYRNQACTGQEDYNTGGFFGSYDCVTSTSYHYWSGNPALYPVAHNSTGVSGAGQTLPIAPKEYYVG